MLGNVDLWGAAKAVASALLAIPGIVAFIWTWKDRQDRRKAEIPYIVWNIDPEPDTDGWHSSEFSLLNRWDEPLYGRHIQVLGVAGTVIAMPHKLPSGEKAPDTDAAAASMSINWYFWSSSQTGQNPSSGATTLYIRPPKKIVSGLVQSGNGAAVTARSMEKLALEITCISASNRRVRCKAIPVWHKRINHRARTK